MGAGHSHGAHRAHRTDEPEFQVGRRPRTILLALLALAALVTVTGVVTLWPDSSQVDRITSKVSFAAPGVTFPVAVVDRVRPPCRDSAHQDKTCNTIAVTVQEGAGKGDKTSVQVSPQVSSSGLQDGDRVKLQRTPGHQGTDPAYGYFGTVRTTPLLLLTLVFAALVVLTRGGAGSSRCWGSPSAAS